MKDIIVYALGLNSALWFVLFINYSEVELLGVSAVTGALFYLSILLSKWVENKTRANRIKVKGAVKIDENDFTSIFNNK